LLVSSTVGGVSGGVGSVAGDIHVAGDRVLIDGGALVDSSTAFGRGKAGNVFLEATESIKVVGRHPDPELGYASTVSSGTLGEGPGGTVKLSAPLIVVDDRGVISTAAVPIVFAPQGVGGDVTWTGFLTAAAR
jgi:hypothetical protein